MEARLSRFTPQALEKFRRPQLIDSAVRSVRVEIRLWHAHELVEPAHNFRVPSTGAQLRQIAEEAEPDEECEEGNGAHRQPLQCAERSNEQD
jgi:hypothetical protein